MTEPELDCVILGAGRRGLLAALELRQTAPQQQVAVVDPRPQPGGDDRTQRSNGFGCELGAFAFAREEVDPLLRRLDRPPALVEVAAEARHGRIWTGVGMVDTEVEPVPVSFATGIEELWQACRRELGSWLRLGRGTTAVRRTHDGWQIDLDGEVPATLRARELSVALPLGGAASLLGLFDPALGEVAGRLRSAPGAFVFFGDHQQVGETLPGYGIAASPEAGSRLVEAIHCSRAFPGRAIPGRCLWRCELTGIDPAGSDDELAAAALDEVGRWLGQRPRFGFVKVHRFVLPVGDGAHAECRIRLRGLQQRVGALTVL